MAALVEEILFDLFVGCESSFCALPTGLSISSSANLFGLILRPLLLTISDVSWVEGVVTGTGALKGVATSVKFFANERGRFDLAEPFP